jgi:hypothetical protein
VGGARVGSIAAADGAVQPADLAGQALAQPGEVVVSQTVKDLVTGSGLALTDRGVHELKGVPEAWRVFLVAA